MSARTHVVRAALSLIAAFVSLSGATVPSRGATGPSAALVRTPALPRSRLAVWSGGEWREWWRSERAPTRWDAPLPAIANVIVWTPATAGVRWGELRIAGSGEAWRLRVILLRVDPRRVRFELRQALRSDSLAGAWTVDSVPASAVLAVNAGQFSYGRPWGLVVRDGVMRQAAGSGPLSTAVLIDSAGVVSLATGSDVPRALAATHVAEAFQSYPTLLQGSSVPLALRAPNPALDVAHRDARLALGVLPDGELLFALTRWDGLEGVLSVVPFGPTTPEMAALMGALGCRDAVSLDGGISGQLMLRDARGEVHAWRGLRKVPLGLVALARS